jgi:hypothetical protein
MVRWKNRTPEDKERILKEQKQIMENKRISNMTPFGRLESTKGEYFKIYERGGLPIACMKDGYVESEKYEIGNFKDPFSGIMMSNMVKGKCPICHQDILRLFPPLGSLETFLFAKIVNDLKCKGRMDDNR